MSEFSDARKEIEKKLEEKRRVMFKSNEYRKMDIAAKRIKRKKLYKELRDERKTAKEQLPKEWEKKWKQIKRDRKKRQKNKWKLETTMYGVTFAASKKEVYNVYYEMKKTMEGKSIEKIFHIMFHNWKKYKAYINIQSEPRKKRTDFTDRQKEYREYLKSKHWAEVRAYYLNIYPECQLCSKKGILQIHHKTYKHKGNEIDYPDDMLVVCKSCHKLIHTSKLKKYKKLNPIKR